MIFKTWKSLEIKFVSGKSYKTLKIQGILLKEPKVFFCKYVLETNFFSDNHGPNRRTSHKTDTSLRWTLHMSRQNVGVFLIERPL